MRIASGRGRLIVVAAILGSLTEGAVARQARYEGSGVITDRSDHAVEVGYPVRLVVTLEVAQPDTDPNPDIGRFIADEIEFVAFVHSPQDTIPALMFVCRDAQVVVLNDYPPELGLPGDRMTVNEPTSIKCEDQMRYDNVVWDVGANFTDVSGLTLSTDRLPQETETASFPIRLGSVQSIYGQAIGTLAELRYVPEPAGCGVVAVLALSALRRRHAALAGAGSSDLGGA